MTAPPVSAQTAAAPTLPAPPLPAPPVPPVPAQPAFPGFASRLFVSGASAFLVAGAVPALYGVALPVWSRALGLSEGEAGLLLSANGAGAFLAVLAGVFGLPGQTVRAGLAGLALGAALLAAGLGWGPLLAGAAVTGAGFGLLTTSVNRGFLAGFGPRGPGMVGLVNALYGLGAILAPLAFLAAGARPGAVFGMLAALAAILALLAPRDGAPPAPRGLPDLRDRRLLVTLFIFGNGLIEGISVGFGASALIATGLSAETAARLTSGFFLAYVASRLSLTWLAGRVAPARLLVLGLGGAGLAMALAALGLPGPGYVAAGAFVGMIFPSYYVWAMRILGEDGRMTAAILTMALLGGMIAPVALRPLLAAAGADAVFAVVAVVGLGMATLFALLEAPARRLAAPVRAGLDGAPMMPQEGRDRPRSAP